MLGKASVAGLSAEEYRNELAADDGWTGFVELDGTAGVTSDVVD